MKWVPLCTSLRSTFTLMALLCIRSLKKMTGHHTVPAVFIRGEFVGGCEDVKSLYAKGGLEDRIGHLTVHKRVMNAEKLETAHLIKMPRGSAVHPLFWFPNVVNNYVVRLVGMQVCLISVIAIVFREEIWGQYLAVALLVDFATRFFVGSSLSLLGMIATVLSSPWRPEFKPGQSQSIFMNGAKSISAIKRK